MALNDLGEQIFERPITLPKLKIAQHDEAAERREIDERFAQQRIIRAGRDAWQEIGKAGSFEAWCKIGAALALGRDFSLRSTAANAPTGRRYSWTFSAWCKQHGFGDMKPATRSWCLALHENLAAITKWRDSLPTGRGRRPPVAPLSCVRGWQRSQANGNGHAAPDWKCEAVAAWRRFLVCVQALPADQAAPLWDMVYQTKGCDLDWHERGVLRLRLTS